MAVSLSLQGDLRTGVSNGGLSLVFRLPCRVVPTHEEHSAKGGDGGIDRYIHTAN